MYRAAEALGLISYNPKGCFWGQPWGLFSELERGVSVLYTSVLLPATHVVVVKVSLNSCQGVFALLRYSMDPKCEVC